MEKIDFSSTNFEHGNLAKYSAKKSEISFVYTSLSYGGSVSQIFYLGLRFCVINSRKLNLKIDQKLPVF